MRRVGAVSSGAAAAAATWRATRATPPPRTPSSSRHVSAARGADDDDRGGKRGGGREEDETNDGAAGRDGSSSGGAAHAGARWADEAHVAALRARLRAAREFHVTATSSSSPATSSSASAVGSGGAWVAGIGGRYGQGRLRRDPISVSIGPAAAFIDRPPIGRDASADRFIERRRSIDRPRDRTDGRPRRPARARDVLSKDVDPIHHTPSGTPSR